MPTQCGTITVQEAFSAADLTTETCQITSSGPYNPGDSVRVEIGVRNDNPVEGTATVVLLADESQIASGQITVGANTSASTTLSGSLPAPSGDSGSFNIVTEVSTATKGDLGGDNPSLPGNPGVPIDGPGNDLPRVTPDSRRGSGSTTTSRFDGVY